MATRIRKLTATHNAHDVVALGLLASDPAYPQVRDLTALLGRLLWKRRLGLLEPEELADLEDVRRQLHNLIDPLARSSPPLAEDVILS